MHNGVLNCIYPKQIVHEIIYFARLLLRFKMSHATELTNLSIFAEKAFVQALKGRTKNVSKAQCRECIRKLEALARYIIDPTPEGDDFDRLVLIWDGDDIDEASFTEALHLLVQMLTTSDATGVDALKRLRDEGKIYFVYTMATTSPYGIKHAPRGLEALIATFGADHVFSLVAGQQSGPVVTMLAQQIEQFNLLVNHSACRDASPLTMWQFVSWVQNFVNPIFGDGTNMWGIDSSSGRFERGKYNNYGYMLLGLAFARVANPRQIMYVGLGPVSIAEREYHANMTQNCYQCVV